MGSAGHSPLEPGASTASSWPLREVSTHERSRLRLDTQCDQRRCPGRGDTASEEDFQTPFYRLTRWEFTHAQQITHSDHVTI